MKVLITLLLAVATQAAPKADPYLAYGYGLPSAGLWPPYAGLPYAHAAVVPTTQEVTYKTITPTIETNVVATGAAVPVAVGGYKAVAGSNGDLAGPVHEVPALFGAPALDSQVNEDSQGSLTVGTSAFITHTAGEPIVNEHTVTVPGVAHYFGKREAEPFLGYGYGLPYAGYGYGLPYAHAAVVPATQEVTYKTITPTVETNVVATNLPVPVAVGGYKSVAGDNGELKGAVHEVPALFGAPALYAQDNEGTSLTVGTSAVITHTAGEPIVNEHTINVPVAHYIGKREAEAEADPYLLYGGLYNGAGYGLGYGYGAGYGLGYGYGLHGYGSPYGYAYYG